MYIEQGYIGKIGLWKFFVIPILFIGYVAMNYMLLLMAGSDDAMTEMMAQMVDQLGSNLFLVFALAPFAFGLMILIGWATLVHPQPIRAMTTSRRKIDWGRIFYSFFFWGTITIAMTIIGIYLAPDDYVWNFQADKFIVLLLIAVLLIPLQTSFEEYLFRGHMMQGLGILTKNRWVPLVITSVIFGLMHIANPEVEKLGYGLMVYYIGTGFFLGIMTLMDEGLELALGFHAANNLFTAVLVTADWTAFQTHSLYRDVSDPTLGLSAYIPVFVIFPLVLFFFGKKYGWSQWMEKLTGRVMTQSEFAALQDGNASSVQA